MDSMDEKLLENKLNLAGAKIFLNTFGLILDNVTSIQIPMEIEIFNHEKEVVGKCKIEKRYEEIETIIEAECKNDRLEATLKTFRLSNIEWNENEIAFSNEVKWKVLRKQQEELEGIFTIYSTLSDKNGLSFYCQVEMKTDVKDYGLCKIWFNRLKTAFIASIKNDKFDEGITVGPGSELDNFYHCKKSSEFDSTHYVFPYSKVCGIGRDTWENGEETVQVYRGEQVEGKYIDLIDEVRVVSGTQEEENIKKACFMNSIDPDMFVKLNELRNIFMFGEMSLVDNFISVCLDRFTEREIYNFFGTECRKGLYQNGLGSLVESYFGICKDNAFYSIDENNKIFRRIREKLVP